ncbi:GNAT family N-acetyltransferase [Metabacillus sp. Hm71]
MGAGKCLMQEAIKKAKEMVEIEQIYLTVMSTNHSAKRLYSSLGFEIFGTDKRAIKLNDTYFNEDLMVLFL